MAISPLVKCLDKESITVKLWSNPPATAKHVQLSFPASIKWAVLCPLLSQSLSRRLSLRPRSVHSPPARYQTGYTLFGNEYTRNHNARHQLITLLICITSYYMVIYEAQDLSNLWSRYSKRYRQFQACNLHVSTHRTYSENWKEGRKEILPPALSQYQLPSLSLPPRC